MKQTTLSKLALITAMALCVGTSVRAAVSAEEAKQLGTTLTPVGGEVAGNKDGTIPAWDINKTIKSPAPNYKPRDPRGGPPFTDPYPNDKPLFSITAENMDKYLDKLDAGSIYLLKNRAGYRMDIYPTHRSIAFPEWIYDNTKKCATTAKLTSDGLAFTGAHACVPFPIPKNGNEAMWNTATFYQPPYETQDANAYLVDNRGVIQLLAGIHLESEETYWDNSLKDTNGFLRRDLNEYLAPSAKVGARDLSTVPFAINTQDPQQWSYTPGLRRVRLVPEMKYDTVVTVYGGIYLADELGGFKGRMDRFDFKLAGKKEMYIQYNGNEKLSTPADKYLGKQFPNPDLVHWELHRVWVIEATLKAGMRHSQSRKVFYLDEDTWAYSAYNAFDSENKIVKATYGTPMSDGKDLDHIIISLVIYDFTRGFYAIPAHDDTPSARGVFPHAPFPPNEFSPESVAGSGVR